MRFEVGTSSGVDCASLGQCLRIRGFVSCQCLLFCPSFWCVSMTIEVHKTCGP
jgi:hypothetical protein